jgi:predicted SpoU family rRNA methylase
MQRLNMQNKRAIKNGINPFYANIVDYSKQSIHYKINYKANAKALFKQYDYNGMRTDILMYGVNTIDYIYGNGMDLFTHVYNTLQLAYAKKYISKYF